MDNTNLRDTLEMVLFLLEGNMCGYEEEITKDIRIAIDAIDRANDTAKKIGYLNEDEEFASLGKSWENVE